MMKSVIVFGKKIPIKYVKDPMSNGQACYGYFDVDANLIIIKSNCDEDIQQVTLYHEIGHALFCRTGVSRSIPLEFQEIIVEQYAQLMFDLFGHV